MTRPGSPHFEVVIVALVLSLPVTACYATNANGGLGVDCSQGGGANAFGLSIHSGPATRERNSEGWTTSRRGPTGAEVMVSASPRDFFWVSFGAADGSPLTIGDYESTSAEPGPLFFVFGNGWSPVGVTNTRFTIHDIAFEGSEVRRIRASFFVEDRTGESSGCVRYTAS